jgi:HK97 family phage major capsid protein
MARRYLNGSAIPDSPQALAEYLTRPDAMKNLFGDGATSAGFHAAYMRAFAARDRGQTAGQLADQAGELGPLLRALAPRSSALNALYVPGAPGASPAGTNPYSSIGEFAKDVAAAAPGRPGRSGPGERLRQLQNSFGTDVPSDGGFLLPEEWRSDMVLASLEHSVIRPKAIVLPSAAPVLHIPFADDTTHATTVLGGITGGWGDEGALTAESSAKFGDLALGSEKLSGYSTAPNELVADSGAHGVFIRETWPMGIGWFEDQGFLNGSGAGEPLGIVSAPCKIDVTRGTASTVKQADVLAMLTRLLPQSFRRCEWAASPDVLTQLLGDFVNFGSATTGVAAPTSWLQSDPVAGWTLLGRPLNITEHVPALGTAGDLVLYDPTMFVIMDHLVMALAASAHASFSSDKTQFRIVSRLGGRMWPQSAVTPRNASATVSPVVRLV